MVEYEQGIRYGTIPVRRPDRIAHHAPTTYPSGKDYPSSNLRALATEQSMDLATEASCMVPSSITEPACYVDALSLPTDRTFACFAFGKTMAI